jgi:metacaspase-1
LLVKPLPAGVRMTCIFDSCHSGTALDLPFVYHAPTGDAHESAHTSGKGGISALLGRQDFGAISKSLAGGATGLAKAVGTAVASEAVFQGAAFVRPKLNATMNKSKADVIMFSGCRDEQVCA